MNSNQLDQCFAAIVAAWPHFKPLPETFALGERLLGPMDPRAVAAAIEQMSLEGREFAPPLGLVARRAHEIMAEITGERVPDADQALAEVFEKISRVGIYQTPSWSHPAIGSTIEALGGWEETCLDDNREAYRAHFMRLYDRMRARVEREALIAPSMRELLDEFGPRRLPPVEPERIEIVTPPAISSPADRDALLAAVAELNLSVDKTGAFREERKFAKVDAHSFGDHTLCGPTCPDRPVEPAPEPPSTESAEAEQETVAP